ncbi:toxin co-regulated pilus biosynthesis Q family protein [Novosphingobium terrae]|uniref:toxin co-regulated pilus biosynthesis Q family protein n=1 Tax=Novosphingobium terrae TaxID=2726189 RepID=UPI00198078D9|nr:toxin co-regulated pilus biosynthesis Q family protein [Novosphingobium terrae]
MIFLLLAAAVAAPVPATEPVPAGVGAEVVPSQVPTADITVMAPEASIVEKWTADRGEYLSAVLGRWAKRADWKLVYESDADYRLSADGVIEGDFKGAVSRLIGAYSQNKPLLRIHFYNGNSVLRVWVERSEP